MIGCCLVIVCVCCINRSAAAPANPSPSIVLHSPAASEQESVRTPSSADLALLNTSLHDISAEGLSAAPSAVPSPSIKSNASPSSSGVMSSDSSPSGSGVSSPGLPSLSAMLDRQLEEANSSSDKNEESIPGADEEDEDSMQVDANQTQLDANASKIAELIDMQSERFVAAGSPSLSTPTSGVTGVSDEERARGNWRGITHVEFTRTSIVCMFCPINLFCDF